MWPGGLARLPCPAEEERERKRERGRERRREGETECVRTVKDPLKCFHSQSSRRPFFRTDAGAFLVALACATRDPSGLPSKIQWGGIKSLEAPPKLLKVWFTDAVVALLFHQRSFVLPTRPVQCGLSRWFDAPAFARTRQFAALYSLLRLPMPGLPRDLQQLALDHRSWGAGVQN